ncbi:hypothetical protein [Paeniglutamicibacter cryotolerans]|uniref:ABC-type multidrug transport system permease subunit n=1 Tax=Paeniglutamicibacter cryotolerans TaxID=670079 RepID=A0A839QJ07_9MICC|nr:hypothetical protein [Paeniglutamicibacter cryotolerans]MBB2995820.1 ABC-type multidrug transport system permease subunit [Paeniglutamicibacter cryotolerans]
MAESPNTPARTPVDLRLLRRMQLTFMLLVAAYLISFTPLPYSIGSLVLGAAAVVTGILSVIRAFVVNVPGMLRVTVPLITVAALLFTLAQGVQTIFYSQTKAFQECQAGALTERSKAACERDYQRSILRLEPSTGS